MGKFEKTPQPRPANRAPRPAQTRRKKQQNHLALIWGIGGGALLLVACLIVVGGTALVRPIMRRQHRQVREADEQIAPLHDRMPLFITPEAREDWLRGGASAWEAALSAPTPAFVVAPDEPEQLSLF